MSEGPKEDIWIDDKEPKLLPVEKEKICRVITSRGHGL